MSDNHSGEIYEALGRALKAERAARGLSRQDLAEAAGISYPYLSEIENGTKRASSKALFAIAGALGMTPSELLGTAETMPARNAPARNRPAVADAMPMMAASSAPMPAPDAERPRWRHAARRAQEAGGGDQALLVEEIVRLAPRLSREDAETILRLVRKLAE